MDVKYSTDTKVEDCFRVYKLQQSAFDKEINTAKAEYEFSLWRGPAFLNLNLLGF